MRLKVSLFSLALAGAIVFGMAPAGAQEPPIDPCVAVNVENCPQGQYYQLKNYKLYGQGNNMKLKIAWGCGPTGAGGGSIMQAYIPISRLDFEATLASVLLVAKDRSKFIFQAVPESPGSAELCELIVEPRNPADVAPPVESIKKK